MPHNLASGFEIRIEARQENDVSDLCQVCTTIRQIDPTKSPLLSTRNGLLYWLRGGGFACPGRPGQGTSDLSRRFLLISLVEVGPSTLLRAVVSPSTTLGMVSESRTTNEMRRTTGSRFP